MELKNPKSKTKFMDSHPAFPIFIESETGVSLENWIPIVCTGIFNGVNVVVRSPAEISALYNMGNFGKGSNSRSKPNIVRNNLKIPSFLRKRQYDERTKWSNKKEAKKVPNNNMDKENSLVIKELHSLFDDLVKNDIICQGDKNVLNYKHTQNDEKILQNVSSDTDIVKDNVHMNMDIIKNNINNFDLPNKSVIVLPDSDSEKDNYFEDIKPKLCIDESDLNETLILTLEEAYFLSFGLGCLQIVNECEKPLTLQESWNIFCRVKPYFFIYYAVYHHFRSKGWIVKPGIKFGGDFLLYKKGQSYYHASYVVFIQTIIEDGTSNNDFHSEYDWTTIQNFIRMSSTTGKEILFARVILPKGKDIEILKTSPHSLNQINIHETLLRRWVSSEQKKDG